MKKLTMAVLMALAGAAWAQDWSSMGPDCGANEVWVHQADGSIGCGPHSQGGIDEYRIREIVQEEIATVPFTGALADLYPLGYTSNPWFPVLEVDGLFIRDFIAPEWFTQDVMDTYIAEAPCLDGELLRSLDGDHVYLSCP